MTPYTKQIVELHKIHKAIENCGCNKDDEQGGGDENIGNLLMSLISNDFPKPDLFLFGEDSENDNVDIIDVTNYKIDDLINLCEEKEISVITIECLYESSTFTAPIVGNIEFSNSNFRLSVNVLENNLENIEFIYNNKNYYYYFKQEI